MFVDEFDNTGKEEVGISSFRSLEETNVHPTSPLPDLSHSYLSESVPCCTEASSEIYPVHKAQQPPVTRRLRLIQSSKREDCFLPIVSAGVVAREEMLLGLKPGREDLGLVDGLITYLNELECQKRAGERGGGAVARCLIPSISGKGQGRQNARVRAPTRLHSFRAATGQSEPWSCR